jgi:hypothetical protein
MTDLKNLRTSVDLSNAWTSGTITEATVLTLDDFQLCVLYNILSSDDQIKLFTLKYLGNNIDWTQSYFAD